MIGKLIVGVLVLAGAFVSTSAFADNPSTFSTTNSNGSGSTAADNGQCFVWYNWNIPWGFTHIHVTINDEGSTWSPNGMAYTGGAQVQCTNNRNQSTILTSSFDTRTQDLYSPVCPFGYNPKAWAGIMWSWQDNGCIF
jgi:hypothetical protein